MRGKKGTVFVIVLLFASSFHPVGTCPLDVLKNERVNPYIEDAIPRTMSFGNLMARISGDEVVVGTSKGLLVITDHDLNTVFSANLGSNARKTVIDQIDEDSVEDKGLFVLTEDKIVRIYNENGKELSSLPFQIISDFIVMNTNEDSRKEIVVTSGHTIESYNPLGEKVWSVQGDSNFKKLAKLEFEYFSGFVVSTCNSIHFYSYNGCHIFSKLVPVGEIRDFAVWKTYILILGDRNQILKLNTETKELQKIYPTEPNQLNFKFVSRICPIEYGIAVIGQKGHFQVLSSEGEIMAEDDLEIEIVGFDCQNLDYIQGQPVLQENEDIGSPEIVVSTQIGRIYVYVIHSTAEGYDLRKRELYEINKIKHAAVFPLATENVPHSILVIDMEGKIHSYTIFSNYCDVLSKYDSGLEHYRNHEYHESELLLKEIADPESQNEEVIRNRSILEYYGLLEQGEIYLERSQQKLCPLIEKGRSEAEIGYRSPDPKRALEHLFSAYQKFSEADIHKDEAVYDSRTLNDLKTDICMYILNLLGIADAQYQELEYKQSLQNFLIIYPKMEILMVSPSSYVKQAELSEYEDLGEKYQDTEDVKRVFKNSIYILM